MKKIILLKNGKPRFFFSKRCRHALVIYRIIGTVLLLQLLQLTVFGTATMDYTLTDEGKRAMTPLCYSCDEVIGYLGDKGGTFSDASDIYIDKSDNIYITDTEKNRIIMLDENGSYLREFTNSGKLSGPQSVFVCDNGDLFVADTNNKQIVHIDGNDREIETFVKPETEVLGDDTDFLVSRLAVSDRGLIYVVQSQQFMAIDSKNDFKGFIGANKVGFSLKEFFVRTFGSDIQKEKMTYNQAATYNSFEIGGDGLIYAVANDNKNQIRVLNMDGENLFPEGRYGETSFDEDTAAVKESVFVDICVDESGIIYALDRSSGRICVYTAEGDNLVIFGGLGEVRGKFQLPVAMDSNSKGEIFVLDASNGTVHKFTPTSYMNNLKQAYVLFRNGEYDKSADICNNVLSVNNNSCFINTLIGRIEYKRKNFDTAMSYFEKAGNRKQYAKAFSEARHNVFREYFVWIVIAAVVVLATVIFIIAKVRRKAEKIVDDYYSGG